MNKGEEGEEILGFLSTSLSTGMEEEVLRLMTSLQELLNTEVSMLLHVKGELRISMDTSSLIPKVYDIFVESGKPITFREFEGNWGKPTVLI